MVNRHYGTYKGYVIAHILRKEGTNRTVDQASGKDSLFRRTPLSTLKTAGYTPNGIKTQQTSGKNQRPHAASEKR